MVKRKVTFGLYLMTEKGLASLVRMLAEFGPNYIAFVVAAKDNAVKNDCYDEIFKTASESGIPVYSKSDKPFEKATHLLAFSWRWMIEVGVNQQLIVFHDSLLPRYRGFSPLVCALVNGDREIGVTAVLSEKAYDSGPIVGQDKINIQYPITIAQAINNVVACYERLALDVGRKIISDKLKPVSQDESKVSYSLWRDDDDYYIDWSWDAKRIRRFVDAVGPPYKGAAVKVDGEVLRVRESVALPEVAIENRTPGKVIFMENGCPVVVCGEGLLKILCLTREGLSANVLPLEKFRTRFSPV